MFCGYRSTYLCTLFFNKSDVGHMFLFYKIQTILLIQLPSYLPYSQTKYKLKYTWQHWEYCSCLSQSRTCFPWVKHICAFDQKLSICIFCEDYTRWKYLFPSNSYFSFPTMSHFVNKLWKLFGSDSLSLCHEVILFVLWANLGWYQIMLNSA